MFGPQVGLQPSLEHLRGFLIVCLTRGVMESRMNADIVIFLVVRCEFMSLLVRLNRLGHFECLLVLDGALLHLDQRVAGQFAIALMIRFGLD